MRSELPTTDQRLHGSLRRTGLTADVGPAPSRASCAAAHPLPFLTAAAVTLLGPGVLPGDRRATTTDQEDRDR